MNEKSDKDTAVTVILVVIWFLAAAIIRQARDDIPLYFLGIGTVFFLILVPSMKELVKSAEKHLRNHRRAND